MAEVRWQVAGLLDRLPGFCWSNLVDWALSSRPERRRLGCGPLGCLRVDDICRGDAGRTGRCYCGKLGASGTRAASSACCIRCERLNPGDPCPGCYCHEDWPAAGPAGVTR